jgi:hypothetical protein
MKHRLENAFSKELFLKDLKLFVNGFHMEAIPLPFLYHSLQEIKILLTNHIQLPEYSCYCELVREECIQILLKLFLSDFLALNCLFELFINVYL